MMFKVSPPPLKKRNGSGLAESDLEMAGEFNGQFTDVFIKFLSIYRYCDTLISEYHMQGCMRENKSKKIIK